MNSSFSFIFFSFASHVCLFFLNLKSKLQCRLKSNTFSLGNFSYSNALPLDLQKDKKNFSRGKQ